jgi:hypothetical protein
LTVLIGPGIAVQPQNVTAVAGDTVTFSITVSNTATFPLGFRWRTNNLTTVFLTLNSHTSVLTVTNVTTNTIYNVVVTNAANVVGVLSASARLTVLADSDGDHVPDVWMAEHFGHTNAQSSDLSRANDDADGDTMGNLAEYIAGTNPRDSFSCLKIQVARGADGALLSFQAISNRTYTLLSREHLRSEITPWQRLENILAAPTNRVIVLTPPLGRGERYYQLITPLRP